MTIGRYFLPTPSVGRHGHGGSRRLCCGFNRRDFAGRGPASGPGGAAEPRWPAEAMPLLRRQGPSLRQCRTGLARPGGRPGRSAAGHSPDLLQASMLVLSAVLRCRDGRSGLAPLPLHAPCSAAGGAPGDRGRPALSDGQLASLARPPRLRALRHDPELGRGGGKKKAKPASKPNISTRPWPGSAAIWRPTKSTTGRSACW